MALLRSLFIGMLLIGIVVAQDGVTGDDIVFNDPVESPPPAVDTDCSLGITFQPFGFDDQSSRPWQKLNQQAAGNMAEDKLFPVVIASYLEQPVQGPPRLYLRPKHFLVNNASKVPCSCWMLGGYQQSSAGGDCTAEPIVVKPAEYRVMYNMYGIGAGAKNDSTRYQLPATGYAYFRGGNSLPTPPVITLPNLADYPDGRYCLNITIELRRGSADVQYQGTKAQVYALPDVAQFVNRQVCFYKLDTQPRAKVNFRSCDVDFGLYASNITAPGITIQTSNTTWKMLLKPLVHCWGKYNTSIQNATVTYDPSFRYDGNYINTFDEFLVPGDTSGQKANATVENLLDGYYKAGCEVSVSSDLCSLVDTYGQDIGQGGDCKWMGFMLNSGRQFGFNVQNRPSAIRSISGPESMEVDSDVQFSWTWSGYGGFYCKLDGSDSINRPSGGGCAPPLYYRLSDARNHTFELTFVDVCNNKIYKKINFGVWGYEIVVSTQQTDDGITQPDTQDTTPVFVPGTGTTRKYDNGASSSSVHAVFWSAFVLLAALML